MARVGIAGYLNNKAKFLDARPTLIWIMDQLENAINGQLDSTNLAASAVGTTQIADGSVTAVKVLTGSLTSTQMADGVGQVASGTYTGDNTNNRVVSVGFTPRWIQIIRTDATFIEYVAIAQGGTTTFWSRDTAGAQSSTAVTWQGITTNGFKLGTAPSTSNATGVVYVWAAYK